MRRTLAQRQSHPYGHKAGGGEGRRERMNVKKENREGKRTEKDGGCVRKFKGQQSGHGLQEERDSVTEQREEERPNQMNTNTNTGPQCST